MEWYEHEHHEQRRLPQEAADMSALERLTVRLARAMQLENCLLCGMDCGAEAAISLLYASALGERALLPGDQILVLSFQRSSVEQIIKAHGTEPVCLLLDVSAPAVNMRLLESKLSPATRAVILEYSAEGHINPETVRNFCNKYDLWMIEDFSKVPGRHCTIQGRTYPLGAIGDWSYGSLDGIGIQLCGLFTRDDLLSSLLSSLVHDAMDDAVLKQEAAHGCEIQLADLHFEGVPDSACATVPDVIREEAPC